MPTIEEIQEMIREAILEERQRVASKISCTEVFFKYCGNDINEIDLDKTFSRLAKSILQEDY